MRKSTPFDRSAQTPAHRRRATQQRQDALCVCVGVCKAVAEVVIVYSQSLTPYFAHAEGRWGGRECYGQKSGKDSGERGRGPEEGRRPFVRRALSAVSRALDHRVLVAQHHRSTELRATM